MEEKDKKRFVLVIVTLAFNAGLYDFNENLENEERDKAILKFYFSSLKEYSIEQIESAIPKALKKIKNYGSPKIPQVSEIVQFIEGDQPQLEDFALVQANKILTNLKYYGKTQFPCDIDQRSTRLMNSRWNYYRWAETVLEPELKWWVKEFCEAYLAEEIVNNSQYQIDGKEIKQLTDGIGD